MASTVEIAFASEDDYLLTGNPIYALVQSEGAPVGATDYRLLLKIIAEGDIAEGAGTFYDQIIPNDSNSALFEIQGYLDIPVAVSFNFPVESPVHGYYDRTIGFKITPGESYIDENGDLQEDWGEELGYYFGLRGGVSDATFVVWLSESTLFAGRYPGLKALTYRANPSTVLPGQPVKLWYIWNHSDQLAGSLVVTAHYSDGSTDVAGTDFSIYTDALYEFDCNPSANGLVLDDGDKNCLYYEVEVNGIETWRFDIDWNYHERPFYLMVLNGLGGVDDIALTGNWETRHQAQATTAWQPLLTLDQENIYSGSVKVTSKTGQRQWQLNTGWLTTSEAEPLAGTIAMAKQAWLLVPDANASEYTVVPVIIDDNSVVGATREGQNMNSIRVAITEAHDNKYY